MTKSVKHCDVFKKLSAAEASESVYMRERVKYHFVCIFCLKKQYRKLQTAHYEQFELCLETEYEASDCSLPAICILLGKKYRKLQTAHYQPSDLTSSIYWINGNIWKIVKID